MLDRIHIRGFKSLQDVELRLPRMVVLFGPNAVGKSNFLDAVTAFSRVVTERTLTEALTEPVRGYAAEAFTLPPGGLPELLKQRSAQFSIEGDLRIPELRDERTVIYRLRYRVGVEVQPTTGVLRTQDEYFTQLNRNGEPTGLPRISVEDGRLMLRQTGRPGHPRHEPLSQNHTLLSDPRLTGRYYPDFPRARNELASWRHYYLDPRTAMRQAVPPREVTDIGPTGGDLAPYLFGLKHQFPKHFAAVVRSMRAAIPSITDVEVDLDTQRGSLDIQIEQEGTRYSSRVISEGTLRLLALCALAVNPWPGSLIAFEEPENGVHPRRLDRIADLLVSTAVERDRQLLVTTHAPRLVSLMLDKKKEYPSEIGLFVCTRSGSSTAIRPFDDPGPLFEDHTIEGALTTAEESRAVEEMLVRGWIDG